MKIKLCYDFTICYLVLSMYLDKCLFVFMLSNNSNLLQSTLAVSALFLVISLATVTITSLNPIIEESTAMLEGPGVAGISTDAKQKYPLDVNLSNSSLKGVFTSSIVRNNANNSSASIKLNSPGLGMGTTRQEVLELYNPNNQVIRTKVSFYMAEELKGKIKVYLEDEKDTLVMYTIDESYGPKTITLPELSNRNFVIRIESSEQIVEPVELVLSLTEGY